MDASLPPTGLRVVTARGRSGAAQQCSSAISLMGQVAGPHSTAPAPGCQPWLERVAPLAAHVRGQAFQCVSDACWAASRGILAPDEPGITEARYDVHDGEVACFLLHAGRVLRGAGRSRVPRRSI